MIDSKRKQYEAENRVRRLLSSIPENHIVDFYSLLDSNLKNNGSSKTVDEIMREAGVAEHRTH